FGLLAYRADRLKGQPELDSMVSRESAFLLNNVVLVSALFTIFLGTIFPLISEGVAGVQVSVGAPYFNSVTIPLFLLLVFLMGVGPMIAWRKASWDNLRRNFLWPSVASLLFALLLFGWKVREFLPLLGFTLLAFVVLTILFDTALAVRARHRIAGEGILSALATLARRNQRRYGGFIVHLGIVLIIMGIAGSMGYSVEREATLRTGESLSLGRYHILFEGLKGSQQPTHFRVEGAFRVFNKGEDLGILSPALKFFPAQQSPVGRAVYRSNISDDLYLILSGFSELKENQATLKILVRPMVMWMWVGGLVILLGTIVAIWPATKSSFESQVPSFETKQATRNPKLKT
ncbi:MAG: heme lyase CcmF/NrfE family subunit, partial [Deltaproteobacteria bacterium]|nr:heme lyase CcmF/NrfE family subunit [Deltaproteobacteria bacterium]